VVEYFGKQSLSEVHLQNEVTDRATATLDKDEEDLQKAFKLSSTE